MRFTSNVTLLVILLFAQPGRTAPKLKLYRKTTVRFVDKKEGAAAITKRDPFTNVMSRFDRQIRMQTDKDVTYKQWQAFVRQHVLDWKDTDKKKVGRAVAAIRPQLEKLNIPFPKEVRMVKTTGGEEAEAAYCRSNAVVLPLKVLKYPDVSLQRLLVHELFHVLSSHNPVLRRSIYAIIGFKPCNTITLPKTLVNRRITNPDAPAINYYLTITDGGKKRHVVPVLYSKKEKYDTAAGGNLFDYLVFQLMVIEKNGKTWRPKLKNGRAIVIKPTSSRSFLSQIGANTRYIIHPDEIMADNFIHLVRDAKRLRSPQIVEKLGKLLESK